MTQLSRIDILSREKSKLEQSIFEMKKRLAVLQQNYNHVVSLLKDAKNGELHTGLIIEYTFPNDSKTVYRIESINGNTINCVNVGTGTSVYLCNDPSKIRVLNEQNDITSNKAKINHTRF